MEDRRWVLRRRPRGGLQPGDLALEPFQTPDLGDGEVRVRNIYLSLNPTNRLWMSDRDQYMAPVGLGEVMRGGGIGVVEESRADRYKPGDLVAVGLGGWETRSVAPAAALSPVRRLPGVPLTASLSVLGGTGLTAYFGMTEIARPQAGETVVVTAAAGAVGSVAGQIAGLLGARVVGVCGGPEKCAWLTGELGFDAAVDYRRDDIDAALAAACPNGVDAVFENVGGPVLDALVPRMNRFGRIALCGLIATYNEEGPVRGPAAFDQVLMRRLRIEGFIISDYFPRAQEAYRQLAAWVADGRIRWKDHVVQGLENAPEALNLLFSGGNDGKLVVQVSPEP